MSTQFDEVDLVEFQSDVGRSASWRCNVCQTLSGEQHDAFTGVDRGA